MRRFNFILVMSLILFLPGLVGCASFGQKVKAFLSGKPPPQQAAVKPQMVKFSENDNMVGGPRRQYKRMTRGRMEDEAFLNSNAGSLWVMEGQGAYLFSQNIVRMIGDPIGVVMEGEPKEQLQAKVDVIGKLLAKLENRAAARLRNPASQDPQAAVANPTGQAPGQDAATNPPGAAANQAQTPEPAKTDFNVRTVPTRVVERTVDGNYRVKGSQPFMIGPREYKVIVTGVVRAEDFNEEGISATKLLDPKFDIISMRRKDSES